MTAICYIKSLNHLVTANSNNQLVVWDLTTRQIIKTKKVNRKINRLIANHTITTNYNLFVSVGSYESILIWNKNYSVSRGIDSPNSITTYSVSGRELIFANARYIKIFDIDEGKILYKTNNDTCVIPFNIINICDNSYILFGSDNKPICYLFYDWENFSEDKLYCSKKTYGNNFFKKFLPESIDYFASNICKNILIVVTHYHTVYAQINGKKYGPFIVEPNKITGAFFVKDEKAIKLLNSINDIIEHN
ncbi:WD40 family protein [Niemeyer virus]|nr:WD40 family protein [Niemeyer virus]